MGEPRAPGTSPLSETGFGAPSRTRILARDRATLPGEPSRGFFYDVPLHPQPLGLPPRLTHFLALKRRQPVVTVTLVQIGLLDPLPDR